jgi:Fur family ferric uptake transcriptional regulator
MAPASDPDRSRHPLTGSRRVDDALPLRPGLRQTRQRRQVWETVRRLGGHCTADEIAAALQAEQPGVARSTVYRTLDVLSASGMLRAVRLGDGPIHYEVAQADHPHAICQVCQGVLHIEHELITDLERHLEVLHRFRPLRTEVVVVGICDDCARGGSRRAARRRRLLEHVHYG